MSVGITLTGSNATIGNVNVNGRSWQEVILANAIAITDTLGHFVQVDASAFRQFMIVGISSLNQNVALDMRSKDSISSYFYTYNGTAWVQDTGISINIPGDSNTYIFNSENSNFQTYFQSGLNKFQLRYGCTTAPTSGSLTLKLWGVPN